MVVTLFKAMLESFESNTSDTLLYYYSSDILWNIVIVVGVVENSVIINVVAVVFINVVAVFAKHDEWYMIG